MSSFYVYFQHQLIHFFSLKAKKTFCDGRSYLQHYCVLISNVIPAFHSPSRNKEMNGKWSSVSIRNVRRNALINQLYDSSVWGMHSVKWGLMGLFMSYTRAETPLQKLCLLIHMITCNSMLLWFQLSQSIFPSVQLF